jgi:hypothetical protein
VLHLVSRPSLRDSYAASERTRALDIGRMRKEDFMIPLLVEPLDRPELPFELANRTLLDFTDWGRGIEQLFEKLEEIDTPRGPGPRPIPLLTEGPGRRLLLEESETLFSNALSVEQIPAAVKVFGLSRIPSPAHHAEMTAVWAYWQPHGMPVAFSFTYPPSPLPGGIEAEFERSVSWQDLDKIEGQPVETVIPTLLRKTLAHRCRAVGLQAFDFADGNRRMGPAAGLVLLPSRRAAEGQAPGAKLGRKARTGRRGRPPAIPPGRALPQPSGLRAGAPAHSQRPFPRFHPSGHLSLYFGREALQRPIRQCAGQGGDPRVEKQRAAQSLSSRVRCAGRGA